MTEKDIKSIVDDSVKSVLTSENESINKTQLTEIITKSISSCLLSDKYINYLDCRLGEKQAFAERLRM